MMLLHLVGCCEKRYFPNLHHSRSCATPGTCRHTYMYVRKYISYIDVQKDNPLTHRKYENDSSIFWLCINLSSCPQERSILLFSRPAYDLFASSPALSNFFTHPHHVRVTSPSLIALYELHVMETTHLLKKINERINYLGLHVYRWQ
jgi:hypothetical protein